MVEPSNDAVVHLVRLWGEAAGVLADYCDGRSSWAFCDDHNTYAGFEGRDDRFHVWNEHTVASQGSHDVDVDTLLVWTLAVISGRTVGREQEAASLVLEADTGIGRIDGWREAALAGVRAAWERLTIQCPRCREDDDGETCPRCEGDGRLAPRLVLRRVIVALYAKRPSTGSEDLADVLEQRWLLSRDPEPKTTELGEVVAYEWRCAGNECSWEIAAIVSSMPGQPDLAIEQATIRRLGEPNAGGIASERVHGHRE